MTRLLRKPPIVYGSGKPIRLADKNCQLGSVEGLPHVVAFSGGRTSGMMLRTILDQGIDPIVLFANTGKERDETLDFIHEIETRWGVEVHWLEYERVRIREDLIQHLKTPRMQQNARKPRENRDGKMHWFREVNYDSASRHLDAWTPFDELLSWMSVLPNPRVRSCTGQMKIRTMQRYLWSQGIYKFVNYIGYRSDEIERGVSLLKSSDRDRDVYLRFILAEHGVTVEDVNTFWKNQPFDLQLDHYEGNCHLCFLKKRAVKHRLIREQPELTDWYHQWEVLKGSDPEMGANGARWRKEKGHAITELVRDAYKDFVPDPVCEIVDPAGEQEAMDCKCTAAMSLADTDVEDDVEVDV